MLTAPQHRADRLDQFHLLRLLFRADGPRFGQSMHRHAFLTASPASVRDWFYGRISIEDSAILEARWTEAIESSGCLSVEPSSTCVIFLPDLGRTKDTATYVAMFQIHRTRDHRVICLHIPSSSILRPRPQPTDAAIYDMLQRRFVLQVLAPIIRGRRSAAVARKAYPDRLVDIHLKLADVESDAERQAFLLNDTVRTSVTDLLATAQRILGDPCPFGSDLSAIIYALIDYMCGIWETKEFDTTKPAPRADLNTVMVFGEIAHYLVEVGRLDVCLFMAEHQRDNAAVIRSMFTASKCERLILCPISNTHHWVLLYRVPGVGTPPMLMDSLAPQALASSALAYRARELGGNNMQLMPIPASQSQRGRTCALHVVTMACFIAHDPHQPIPVLELRQLVDQFYTRINADWPVRKTVEHAAEIFGHISAALETYMQNI